MAPPPEYDKEPKAPDKSLINISKDDSKVRYTNNIKDHPPTSEVKSTNSKANSDAENKHVETLDDGQLRALLDEAITYKCPKDREGKSSLFKELLEEVEQDEQCEAAARVSGRGRRGRGRREHHSSLQDLVAAMAAESAPRRPRHAPAHPPPASVSARAHHGGSLPSGVDTSFLLSEEPARGGYLATVRCVNPPPLAERRVSASDANPPAELDLLTRSKPIFPVTYTARATLEIGSGSVSSGRAVTTTTASNQVDSAIPFSCITTPEIVSSCNTTTSTTQSDAIDQKQPRSVISSNFNGLPLTRPNYGSTASTTDEYKKSLDENGNAVQGFNSPLSGSSQHKKPRRKKSSKNETVIKSHQIDGYQGNKDLNEVLRFIESNADGARAHKLGRAKHKDDSDDKCTKKRSTERRKDKESKIKRATSMEELSRTKLEDLTDTDPPLRAGKARGPDAAPAKPERRSWGDDARAALLMRPEPPADADAADPAAELTDFQTVTKKRKPRRRTDEAEREPATEPAPRRRPPSPRARRISAPPSDRSNDSNDDMDSVHSLPAAGTRARHPLPATAAAPPVPPALPAPPAPAPPASYADIARTRHNIPDLIESCNFYGEGEAESAVGARATRADSEYPALAGGRRARDKAAGGGPAGEAPAPDVVADRRPAVVLLAAGARARELDGVTFGFDVNEQLLGGARADVVRDAEAVGVRAGCAVLRYLPPPAHTAHHTHLIVDYVQAAWEDIMKCGSGKVKYYSD
ncbi:nucleolar protein dao-5-like isoform X2 [Aricia agestis]|uniref:nucleolar protein dao-5-like isoform X2 n=1 Tax=Aricia agestis TaxID=91739 RepID=UPI001C205028|nr:nucleolar protein dao-5-like isoform X2 [Aricia agestis]